VALAAAAAAAAPVLVMDEAVANAPGIAVVTMAKVTVRAMTRKS
jgi:hypothetical protein